MSEAASSANDQPAAAPPATSIMGQVRVHPAKIWSPAGQRLVATGINQWAQWLRVPLWILGFAALLGAAVYQLHHVFTAYLLDVGVFSDAGRALLHGQDLYSENFPSRSGFRFIYPPFAALLFVWLPILNENLMETIWTVASIAAVGGTIAMVVRRLGFSQPWLWAIALTGLGVLLEPLRAHLIYGQINIFLILLVAADVLGYMPEKLRGLGIGIAAGVKITPAAYAVVFLVRKDWLSVARSALFFLLTALIGFLLRAPESWYYWTEEFFKSDRGGPPPYPPNQALTGLIARAGVDNLTATELMGPGFALVAGIAIWTAFKLERAHRPVESFLLVVLAICIASPVAVTHHWSGLIIALPLLLTVRSRLLQAALVLCLAANFAGLHSIYPPQRTYDFHLWQWVIGNAQGWTGIVLFVVLVIYGHREYKAARESKQRAETAVY